MLQRVFSGHLAQWSSLSFSNCLLPSLDFQGPLSAGSSPTQMVPISESLSVVPLHLSELNVRVPQSCILTSHLYMQFLGYHTHFMVLFFLSKRNRSLWTCIPHVYMGYPKEKWVTQSSGLELWLKYHLQWKTKKKAVEEASYGEITRKSTVKRVRSVT